MMSLKGKSALITGGTAGIGKAIARLYAENGADVAIFGTNRERAEQAFQEMEAPAYRDFNSIISGISNRFGAPSGGGQAQMGARRGSGYQNTLTAAGSNFAQDLQGRRQDLKRQALNDLMGYSNQILGQRPVDKFLAPKPQKQAKTDWTTPLIKGGATVIGAYVGGPGGAAAGNKVGETAADQIRQ